MNKINKGVLLLNLNFKKLNVYYEEISENKGNVYLSPLERGYGYTLGNSLRRVLLSSIPGTSVIGVRIKNANHEFQRIAGTINDGTEIVSRLKEMKFSMDSEEMVKLHFSAAKSGTYYAKDIKLPKGVECLTPDVEFLKLTGETKEQVEMTIYVRKGRGFLDGSLHVEFDEEIDADVIRVDGKFTPINKVSIVVEEMRVGQNTDFEKLLLKVETDGTIKPDEAFQLASKIMVHHLSYIDDMKDYLEQFSMQEEEKQKENEIFDTPISMLGLGVRPLNCLTNAGYTTVGKVLSLTYKQLEAIEQLGAISIKEIVDTLASLGYKLKDD